MEAIPSEAVKSESGKIIGLKFYHVWVEAYNSHGRWVGMTHHKQYRYYDGVDINTIAGIDIDATYNGAMENAIINDDYISGINETNLSNDIDMYKDRLMSYFATNMPDATTKDLFGYREITQKARGLLPPLNNGGVFGISEAKERFSEIPHSLRHHVNFQVSGINHTVASPSISSKSTTISYVPATQYDANLIESYGSIFNVPAWLVRMKPVLKVDGEVVAEGSSTRLGSNQTLYSNFLRPDEETWATKSRTLT